MLFVIKGTYKSGENAGKSFYLGKGGVYVAALTLHEVDSIQCYDSYKTAKMVATRFNNKNLSDERRYPELTIPIKYSAELLVI